MTFLSPRFFSLCALLFAVVFSLSSCTVNQQASLLSRGGETKKKVEKTNKKAEKTWAEKREEARKVREKEKAVLQAKREKEQAAAERKKQIELAEVKKRKELEARKAAAEKRKLELDKQKLAQERARQQAAEEAARKQRLAQQAVEDRKRKVAKLEAKRKAEQERAVRKIARKREAARQSSAREVTAAARSNRRGGLFSRVAIGTTPTPYESEGHHIYVNQNLLPTLNSSNARIEIDLSDQRARVYRTGGGGRALVIETDVSTGKSGHATSTGTFSIKEKLVAKRSTLYGTWVNSSGATVRSAGDSRRRPSGGSRFIGAEMPYWMRINGGIGMHIGYVPDYPASHGCIRVPRAIQPLIFSKVGVGTPVTVKY